MAGLAGSICSSEEGTLDQVIGPAIAGPIGDLRKLEHGNRKRGQFQLCSVSLAGAW